MKGERGTEETRKGTVKAGNRGIKQEGAPSALRLSNRFTNNGMHASFFFCSSRANAPRTAMKCAASQEDRGGRRRGKHRCRERHSAPGGMCQRKRRGSTSFFRAFRCVGSTQGQEPPKKVRTPRHYTPIPSEAPTMAVPRPPSTSKCRTHQWIASNSSTPSLGASTGKSAKIVTTALPRPGRRPSHGLHGAASSLHERSIFVVVDRGASRRPPLLPRAASRYF